MTKFTSEYLDLALPRILQGGADRRLSEGTVPGTCKHRLSSTEDLDWAHISRSTKAAGYRLRYLASFDTA